MTSASDLLPTEAFSHIRIVVGMIVGLCISRLLTGIARLIQHPRKSELYLVHLMWTTFTLLTVVHFWWFEFSLRMSSIWSFGVYVFVLFYASLHFILSTFLVPDNGREYAEYRDYFISARKYFFGFLAAFYVADLLDTLLKGWQHFRNLGLEYPLQIAIFVLLSLYASHTERRSFHAIFAAGALLYQVSFVARKFAVLA